MSTAALWPEDTPVTARQRWESENRSWPVTHHIEQPRSQMLIVSPYTELEHQLDLSSVDSPNRLFALALTNLQTSTPNYATTAYPETFDWHTIFANLRDLAASEFIHFPRSEFYVVEFRSQLREHIDNKLLFQLDKESHREATEAGGLLKYWFGSPDSERRNLATCLWRSKEDAIAGGKGLWHKKARGIISTTYEYIDVKGLRLLVEEGAQTWSFEPWSFH